MTVPWPWKNWSASMGLASLSPKESTSTSHDSQTVSTHQISGPCEVWQIRAPSRSSKKLVQKRMTIKQYRGPCLINSWILCLKARSRLRKKYMREHKEPKFISEISWQTILYKMIKKLPWFAIPSSYRVWQVEELTRLQAKWPTLCGPKMQKYSL